MKKNITKVISIMMMVVMIFALTACAAKTSTEAAPSPTQAVQQKPAEEQKAAGKIDEIKAKGKIVLGTAADYPPYEFHKEINGQDNIVGFDIDIAKVKERWNATKEANDAIKAKATVQAALLTFLA
jgi:polar amino acid transport system substrate-binding protein